MKTIVTILIALGLMAGCATGGVGLRTATDRLDDSSQMFYRQLASEDASRGTVEDAGRFAEITHDFNREVRDGRSSDTLAPMFDRVADAYHDLRERLDDRAYSSRYREAGFERVTEAYLDVERAMDRQYGRRSSYRY